MGKEAKCGSAGRRGLPRDGVANDLMQEEQGLKSIRKRSKRRGSRRAISRTPSHAATPVDAKPESSAEVLTDQQRALVEANLGLVGVHLRSRVPTPAMPRREREYEDLFQEGVIALMRAAARYDPARHGEFGAFAIPRIRGAVFAALHDRFSLIRLPAHITQGRAKPSDDGVGLPHAGGSTSRVLPPGTSATSAASLQPLVEDVTIDADALPLEPANEVAEGDTIRHVIRRRYERAVRLALHQMRSRSWRRRDPTVIMEHLARERLLIGAARARTPLRVIAEAHGISSGRTSDYERQLIETVEKFFADDVQLPLMLGWARDDAAGLDSVVDEARQLQLINAECDIFVESFQQKDRTDQARMMLDLVEQVERRSPGADDSKDAGLLAVMRNLFRMTRSDD